MEKVGACLKILIGKSEYLLTVLNSYDAQDLSFMLSLPSVVVLNKIIKSIRCFSIRSCNLHFLYNFVTKLSTKYISHCRIPSLNLSFNELYGFIIQIETKNLIFLFISNDSWLSPFCFSFWQMTNLISSFVLILNYNLINFLSSVLSNDVIGKLRL
jgi:hypothetical protein